MITCPCPWYLLLVRTCIQTSHNFVVGRQRHKPCGISLRIGTHSLYMMTSSNGNIFRVTGPLCGEFTGPGEFPAQRPVTQSFDVFFDLRLNKWLSKPWGWWFETLSWSLWRHCDDALFCCGCMTSYSMIYMIHLPIFFLVAALTLEQSCDRPNASEVIVKELDKIDHWNEV